MQELKHVFDDLGNLDYRWNTGQYGNTTLRKNEFESFVYDQQNRLKGVYHSPQGSTGSLTQTMDIDYNAAGNITSKSNVGTYSYTGCGAGPAAVCSAGSATYSYDANGNQTGGDEAAKA